MAVLGWRYWDGGVGMAVLGWRCWDGDVGMAVFGWRFWDGDEVGVEMGGKRRNADYSGPGTPLPLG